MDSFVLFLLLTGGFALGFWFFTSQIKKQKGASELREESFFRKQFEDQKTRWDGERQGLVTSLENRDREIKELIEQKANLEGGWQEKSKQIENLEKERERLTQELKQTNTKNLQLEGEKNTYQSQIKSEREKILEIKSQYEKQKDELKNEFKALSEEILKSREQSLNNQNKENINFLLKPLQEQIEIFKKRVNEVHTETVKGNTSLETEIKKVMEMGLKFRDEASNLTLALKGDSKKRGAWGEVQLEQTLQMSGLIEGEHYEKQVSLTDDKGRRKQPDTLIKLPDNKHIVIDSKVSLIDYDRAISAENEGDRLKCMKAYVKAVKRHIDDLASKDYANLDEIDSPSFVLMFMPIEPAYIEALKHDRSLFGYGYDKNIILLSHTTLIPILKTVSNLWMMDKSHKEAKNVSEKAGDLYNTVCLLCERLEKLGSTLNAARKHYNDSLTALTGRQGLQGKIENFRKISKKANKSMPQLSPLQTETEQKIKTLIIFPPYN